MEIWILGMIATAFALLGAAWCWRAAWRMRVRRPIMRGRQQTLKGFAPVLQHREDQQTLTESFRETQLIRASQFLDDASLHRCRQEALDNLPRLKRGFVPRHKQGGTLSYEAIHFHAPACLALYHSPELIRWVSSIVGEPVQPTADHDQSACSLLYYTQPGDYINWHYDPNFYGGRQFTGLIILIDRSEKGGSSASTLVRKHRDGRQEAIDAAENEVVLFEGPRILHKVSPTEPGDCRIVLSMTFNTNPRISLFWELVRRVKDTAFFGLRALWD
jgi:hypothetical protein